MTIKIPVIVSVFAISLVFTGEALAKSVPPIPIPADPPFISDELKLSGLAEHGYVATGETENCVSISRIRNTEVLDDHAILFRMMGKKTYVNVLDRKCSNLSFERAFKYEASGSMLCSIDHIEVVETNPGGMGPACQLGDFHLVEKLEEPARAEK